jgi:hypothetical protein
MVQRIEAVPLPAMRDLLEQAGFAIRSATRADCVHCTGSSRGTVALTDALAFCHRCHWKANRIGLARQLGLLAADRDTERKLRPETRHRQAIESTLAAFECWREARLREVTDCYRPLARQGALAHRVLQRWPDCEPAWHTLARLYHTEVVLLRVLDFLSFAKASIWLERDSTPAEVFRVWRGVAA